MGRLTDLVAMVGEGRLGFLADERMKGAHRFLRDLPEASVRAGESRPFHFKVTWGHPHLGRFLNPLSDGFFTAELQGTVAAGGLIGEAPVAGTLELRYHKDASIRYTFEFEARGRAWRFEGQKVEIRPWNLHRTHTRCAGRVVELPGGEPLSEVEVFFELRTLPRFLASFRLG